MFRKVLRSTTSLAPRSFGLSASTSATPSPSTSTSTSQRRRVLQLYRECLVIGNTPEARDEEMSYIVGETRSLFRQNAALRDSEAIARCIQECEHRQELALHYRNARPRLHNAINVSGQQLRRTGDKGSHNAPTYMNSYYAKSAADADKG